MLTLKLIKLVVAHLLGVVILINNGVNCDGTAGQAGLKVSNSELA